MILGMKERFNTSGRRLGQGKARMCTVHEDLTFGRSVPPKDSEAQIDLGQIIHVNRNYS